MSISLVKKRGEQGILDGFLANISSSNLCFSLADQSKFLPDRSPCRPPYPITLPLFPITVGYIAGAIAGILTSSQNVGVFAPSPSKDVQKYTNGFKSGVIEVCSKCNVFEQFSNTTTSSLLYNTSVASE